MRSKNMKLLVSGAVFNVLGLILICIALPIEKLSVLWGVSFICGFISLILVLYVCKKKKSACIIFFISIVIMISFPLTYIVNIQIVDEKYKNQKVETLVIPSKFTPIQQGVIYDLSDDNAEESIVYFTDGDRKANLEAEKIMVSAIINSKYNRKIYYYDLSKMPTREVNYVKKHFVSDGKSCVVRIEEGVLAEEINVKSTKSLHKFLERNM